MQLKQILIILSYLYGSVLWAHPWHRVFFPAGFNVAPQECTVPQHGSRSSTHSKKTACSVGKSDEEKPSYAWPKFQKARHIGTLKFGVLLISKSFDIQTLLTNMLLTSRYIEHRTLIKNIQMKSTEGLLILSHL